MKRVSNLISYLFHPIFYFSYLYGAYWWLFPIHTSANRNSVLPALGFVFVLTALLPIILLVIAKKNLVGGNLTERRFSVLVTAAIYLSTYHMFRDKLLPDLMANVLLASVVGLSMAYIFNLRYKLSLHASGAGGLLAVMAFCLHKYGGNFVPFFIVALLIAGLVGSARLYLKAHTQSELYSGYILGFSCSYAVLSF